MIRLAYVTSHPIQYQAPLFRHLAARDDVTLKVFFSWDFGVKTTHDPGFGRAVKWDIPLLDGYDHAFIKNRSRRPGVDHFFGLMNPGIVPSLLAFKPDAVVVHGYAHATENMVFVACKATGIPVLVRGESNLLPQRSPTVKAVKRLGALYLKRMLAGAIAIGTYSREYFIHHGVAPERVFVAPYVVDNDFFQSKRPAAEVRAKAWRAELGIAPEAKVVGFAAKLSAVKSCGDLIDAFAAAGVPDSALVIVGDGPLKAELEAKARGYKDAVIHFTGFANQSEMPAAYALCDVFALPSQYEPWGLAINEAMNLGRPVIVSDQVGCVPDLVNASNAWVFKAQDVADLTQAIRRALADRDVLKAKGEAALATISASGIPECAQGIVAAANAVRA